MADVTFREYFSSVGENPALTDREKTFIGLAVTLSRGCEP